MTKLTEEKILKQMRELSKTSGLSINELRTVLALERAVARIEAEPKLTDHLIFKGGFLLFKSIDTTRYTRDIDALANGISLERVKELMGSALQNNLSDCMWFLDIQEAPLPNQGPYGGLQFSVAFQISSTRPDESKIKRLSRIHIDVGFGDLITLPKQKIEMRPLLNNMQPVSWLVYPLESVLAEKLESILRRGSTNSRAKDMYDLVLLFDKFQNLESVKKAIKNTFKNRKTPIPESFHETVKSFDTKIMEQAWHSVYMVGPKANFNEIKTQLLKRLAKLDKENMTLETVS